MLREAPACTDLVACIQGSLLRIVRASTTTLLRSQQGGQHASASLASTGALVDPAAVAEASLQSLNYHAGILLLEEMLLLDEARAQARGRPYPVAGGANSGGLGAAGRKRSRGGGASAGEGPLGVGAEGGGGAQQDVWLQLSRLYAALGEDAVLVGLSARWVIG